MSKLSRLLALLLSLIGLVACTAEPTPATTSPTTEPTIASTVPPTAEPGLDYQIGRLRTAKIDIFGVEREYTIFVPPLTGDAMPLVVGLHGLGGNGTEFDFRTGLSTLAREKGFVVVYPQGSPDDNSSDAWFLMSGPERDADIAFIRRLVADVIEVLPIDSERIYAAGESLGGGMANRLGCDAADLFTGVAVVSGVLFEYDNCFPSEPISVISVHGAQDDAALFQGAPEYGLPVIAGWAKGWSVLNNCASATTEEPIPTIRRVEWLPCENNKTVTLYAMMEAGHGWPNPNVLRPQEGDAAFDATAVIWEFFEANAP